MRPYQEAHCPAVGRFIATCLMSLGVGASGPALTYPKVPRNLRHLSFFGAQDSGFRVQSSGLRVQAAGFRVQVQGLEFRVQGLEFWVQGLEFRVLLGFGLLGWGSGFRALGLLGFRAGMSHEGSQASPLPSSILREAVGDISGRND